MNFVRIKNSRGYSLVEVVITVGLSAVVLAVISLSMFTYRNNIEYDNLFHEIIESVHSVRSKAMSSRLDDSDNRTSYSIKFLEDKFVEYEGDVYTDGDSENLEHDIPFGFRLGSLCNPDDDGTITFSPVKGENANMCEVYIYKLESADPLGTVVIGKYGLEEAY